MSGATLQLDCGELVNGLDGGVLLLDGQGRIVLWNRWFSDHTGLAPEQVKGRTLPSVFGDDLPASLLEAVEDACIQRLSRVLSWQLHKRLLPLSRRMPNGDTQPIYQTLLLRPQSRGELTLLQCLDMTYAIKREQHLRASERTLRLERKVLEMIATGAALESIFDQLCAIAEQLMPGTRAATLLLNDQRDQLEVKSAPSLGRTFLSMEDGLAVTVDGRTCVQAVLRQGLVVCRDLPADASWRSAIDAARAESVAGCWAIPVFAAGEEVAGVFAVYPQQPCEPEEAERQLLERISRLAGIAVERHRQTEKIRFLALHDPLTGLANRSLLNEHLSRNIHRAQREQHVFALLFIDLDGFKQVNDQYGHDAGDRVLSLFAWRLKEQLRSTDTCARIGGDEFVVILETISSADDAGQVADKILATLLQPIEWEGVPLQVRASIGIAIFPEDAGTADELLTRADDAMYRAKVMGKGRWCRLNTAGRQGGDVSQTSECTES